MHILEQYALNCGAKISKPYINDKFFPLPFDKYITLHPKGKFPSREYDYWEEVLLNLGPILEKFNIKIVQVGGKDDQPLPFCYHTQGQTNFNNLSYIIRNSMLHLGVDSFPIHLASAFDKKIVGLYCNMYPTQSGPYWSKKEDYSLIFSDLKNKKPSYAAHENPKTINFIKPEEIINAVIEKLNLNIKFTNKSLYFGDAYHLRALEIIPDHVPNLSSFNINVANVRMDYYFNEEYLFQILKTYPTNILTNKSLNITELAKYKKNIQSIIYIINDKNQEFDVKFLQNLKNNGIRFSILSFLNEDLIQRCKIDAMELSIINIKDLEKNKNIVNSFNVKNDNLKFKSTKLLLSNGKIFPTFENYLKKQSFKDNINEYFDFKNEDNLYKELENLYIFTID
jgi:hypothetical protein